MNIVAGIGRVPILAGGTSMKSQVTIEARSPAHRPKQKVPGKGK